MSPSYYCDGVILEKGKIEEKEKSPRIGVLGFTMLYGWLAGRLVMCSSCFGREVTGWMTMLLSEMQIS